MLNDIMLRSSVTFAAEINGMSHSPSSLSIAKPPTFSPPAFVQSQHSLEHKECMSKSCHHHSVMHTGSAATSVSNDAHAAGSQFPDTTSQSSCTYPALVQPHHTHLAPSIWRCRGAAELAVRQAKPNGSIQHPTSARNHQGCCALHLRTTRISQSLAVAPCLGQI